MIALIITIIVMLILVAVTVRTVVNSGLFKHAGDAVNTHSMQEAREKLGTTLSGAMAEKYINKDYNENEFLDDYIRDNLPDSKIAGDIVIIDGWAFELDRTVPEIKQNLGKEGDYTFPKILSVTANISDNKETAITTNPLTDNGKYIIKVYSKLMATEIKEITELIPITKLEVTSSNSTDNTYATITVKTQEVKKGIQKIEITKADGTVVVSEECNGNKELIIKDYRVEENGMYTVTVYAENNATKTITITGLAELTTNRTGLKVGDYIAYTPDTAGNYTKITTATGGNSDQSIPQDTTLKWRVMSINNDWSVDIVSDEPISSPVSFRGAIGYNNGVLLLNDLCKSQYSNSTLGVTARSIDYVDIENKFNNTGIAARNNYTYYGTKYGSTKTYSSNYSYAPDIYDRVGNDTIDESIDYYGNPTTKTYAQKGTLTVKQTLYHCSNIPTNYFNDSAFYGLIFGDGNRSYWLASRYANCRETHAEFGLRAVRIGGLSGLDVFGSNKSSGGETGITPVCGIRPVVTLGPNIKIYSGGGTADSPKAISL